MGRADELADAVDDQLQDALDVELGGDRARGGVERREPLRLEDAAERARSSRPA